MWTGPYPAYAAREQLAGRTPLPRAEWTGAFDGALRFARDASHALERARGRTPMTLADVIHKLVDTARWFSEEAQAEAHALVDGYFGKATDVSAEVAAPETPGGTAEGTEPPSAPSAAPGGSTTEAAPPAPAVPTEEGAGADPRAASTEPAGAGAATDEGTTAPDATASAGDAAPAPTEASTVTEMYDAAGNVTGTFDSATGTFTPAA